MCKVYTNLTGIIYAQVIKRIEIQWCYSLVLLVLILRIFRLSLAYDTKFETFGAYSLQRILNQLL